MVLPPHIKTFEEKNITYYSCTACNKTFKSRDHCRYHRYCHSTYSKPFSCSSCDKKFSKKSHLDYHELTHTGELPFKCSRCDKGFRTNQKLKRHIVSHSGKKLVSCYICDKQLSSRDGLRVHLRTHSEKRPFKCEQCDASFRERHALTKHAVTHSGEKNWVCELCGKKYTIRWNLIQHKRTHAVVSLHTPRQFSCDSCDRDFSNQSHLKRHRTIHSEDLEEHVCKICGKAFTRKDNLSRHLKNSHEDEDLSSETITSLVEESKEKTILKAEEINTIMQENTNRSSVIKSVASVMEMAEATCKNGVNKDSSTSQNYSHSTNSFESKEISLPEVSKIKEISPNENSRKVSVISRSSGSLDGAVQKVTGYKILPPLSETLKSEGSDVTFNSSNCSVARALKAENFKNSTTFTAHNSNFFKVNESNAPHNELENCKQPRKLEPFRIINQPNLALNLSAKRATYCVKKCIFDARKNYQKKTKDHLVENFIEHTPVPENGSVLPVNISENSGEEYLDYVGLNHTDIAESRAPNGSMEFSKDNQNTSPISDGDYLDYVVGLNTYSMRSVSRAQSNGSMEYITDNESTPPYSGGNFLAYGVNVNSSGIRTVSRTESNGSIEGSFQSYKNIRISVAATEEMKPKHYTAVPSSYEEVPFSYRKTEISEYSLTHCVDSRDLHTIYKPKAEKTYSISNFSNSFEDRNVLSMRQQCPSVIASLPNLIPIVSNKESGSCTSVNCLSSENKAGCSCKECLPVENQILSSESCTHSSSNSLDLSVRNYLLS